MAEGAQSPEELGGQPPRSSRPGLRERRGRSNEEGPEPEAAVGSEREQVLAAFESAHNVFINFPADKLTPDQQAARDLLTQVKGRTLDRGKTSYVNRFTDETGTGFQQREYLPVDELIIFLRERIKSGELSDKEAQSYREWGRIIHKSSKDYYRGAGKKEDDRTYARITQEQERVSSDPRLTTGDPHDDYLKAARILFERRELIVPPRREPPPPPTPEPLPEETPTEEAEPEPGPTEPTPIITPVEEIRYEATIGNRQMEIRKRAETTAERAIQEEQRRGAWFNPLTWARKVRMRIFEEYYRQQYVRRAEDAMIDNNNSYLEFDVVRNALQNANANIDQERAAGGAKISELGEGGTSQAEILRGGREEIREATGELKALLMDDIIRPIVNGEITDYAQVQERLRQFVQNNPDNQDIRELFGADANRYGEAARYFATDILELGQRIRIDLEAHRFAIEELDSRVTINLANADWAAESQTRFTLADRFIARAQQGRLTGLMGNPAFVGAVTSIGVYGAMRAVGYGGQAAQFVVPGSGVLTGALFAGLRRNYDLKVDRASGQREQTYARDAGPNQPRREALRRYNYDMASVDELLNGGRERFDLGNPNSRGISELIASDLTQEVNREELNRRIAEIRTRLDFSGEQAVDLITFRGEHEVQQGRLELVQAIAEANIELTSSGMTQDEITSAQTRLAGEWNTHFTQDRQQQDRAFAIYRYRNAAGAAIFGGVAGFAGGLCGKRNTGTCSKYGRD